MNKVKIVEVTFRVLMPSELDAQIVADDMEKDVVQQLTEEHGARYQMLIPKQVSPEFELPDYDEDGATLDRTIDLSEAYEALYDWFIQHPGPPRTEMWCCHGKCMNIAEAYLVAGFAICKTCGWVDKNDEAIVEPIDSPV